MKLLIWVCSVCFVWSTVGGMFFELPGNTDASADQGTNDDFMGEAIGGLHQYLGGEEDSQHQGNARPGATATGTTTTTSSGVLDEMETSLEHATDTLDGLWQQFKKGVLSLVGSLSVGESDDNKHINGNNATATANSQAAGTITNQLFAKPTSTTAMPVTTTTTLLTTTTRLVTATTTSRTATELETPSSTPRL